MRFRIMTATLAVAGLATLGLTAATPALAGNHPGPCESTGQPQIPGAPMPRVHCPTTPPPVVTPTAAQEDFDLSLSSVQPNGYVLATGPVRFRGGQDRGVSPTLDVFFQGGRSVRVLHPALGGALVDTATCSITLDQNDLRWLFAGGTGIYRRARGSGVYDLRGIFSYPTRGGKCTLPTGLTGAQAATDLNNNSGLPAPMFYDIVVQGVGTASLGFQFFTPGPRT